jgi:LytS/YehU family sensor histidine kinase
VALREELDIVESYLAIERERFQERLTISIDVPEALQLARVPPLVLQPLVENAVKHGIAPREIGGHVTIRARLEQNGTQAAAHLRLVVDDTGAGVDAEALRDGIDRGVGIRNIERRLRFQYGGEASLSIRSTPGLGTVVNISLPVGAGSVSDPRDTDPSRELREVAR